MNEHYSAALCTVTEHHFDIIARDGAGRVTLPRHGTGGTGRTLGLGLTEAQRLDLGLPACDARNGGSFLAFARVNEVRSGELEPPTPPRDFEGLVMAEIWPLAHAGIGKILTTG